VKISTRVTRARWALLALVAILAIPLRAAAQERGANALGDAIAGLGTTVRVLVIAAHPDDEDTRLITWLQKGHRAEVAYLSLTRGDGGQNLIGNELGEGLGVIRTEEMLAARRLDGAHQYFTRAYDFGFSKSAAETYVHWPHDSILKDVITVIRAFRPQVIVTVFTGTPKDGHGHHQVSAIIGREAYDLAGDSVRFPAKSTQGLAPWTVSKFYRDRTYWGPPYSYSFDAGEYNPLLGESYAEIAVESRSQHRSQGTGALPRKGPAPGYLMREATRVNGGTDSTQESGIFDGIPGASASIWVAAPGGGGAGDSLSTLITAVKKAYDPWYPERTVEPLTRIFRGMMEAPGTYDLDHPSISELIAGRASDAAALAKGIAVQASVDRDVIAVGDTVPVVISVFNRGRDTVSLVRRIVVDKCEGSSASGVRRRVNGAPVETPIIPGGVFIDTMLVVGLRPSEPWWLARPRTGDLFAVPVSTTAETERGPAVACGVFIGLDSAGLTASFWVPVVHRFADPVKGAQFHPLAVAPAITLTLDSRVEYVTAKGSIDRAVRVHVHSAAAGGRSVKVSLRLPKGITADSAARTVTLAPFASATVDFRIHGSLPAGAHQLSAVAESNGQTFTTGYQLIDYDHIRPQTMYRDATVTLEAVDVRIPPGLNIAYIQGVGDNSAPTLQQLGIPVTIIDPATLASADLAPYTTIVIGTRAYEAHPELVANNARLLEWVKKGGTMVVQYGQYEMTQPGIMPYPITLTRPAARVTEENSAVTVLDPKNPLLNAPNAITQNDWTGWVQDRALYMPSTFDSAYAAPLAMHDTGEPDNRGALLIANYGRGTYVYVTLAFFRQLPAGIPGAARIFVNLLGARQPDAPRTTP